MANKIKLSVIIVNWNTKKLLSQCLDSILDSELTSFEIIVVDNNSSDQSVEMVKNFKTKNSSLNIRIIKNKQNLGFAKANNQGIEVSQGKYIMLLNSDTIVKKGSLETLVSYLDQNPDTAAVSPQLLNLDGTKQIDYYMKFPNFWQLIFYHNYPLRIISMKTPLRYLFVSKPEGKVFEVDQLPGAALLIRKKIIDQIGNLDESFNFFFEDVDWCYRIKQETSLNLIVCSDSEIVHIGGGSWSIWLEKERFNFYRQYYLSLIKFFKKHYRNPLFIYKLGLSFSFLINFISHLPIMTFNKAKIQLKLIKALWTKTSNFNLPQ